MFLYRINLTKDVNMPDEFLDDKHLSVDQLTERLLEEMPSDIRSAVERAEEAGMTTVRNQAQCFLNAHKDDPLTPSDLIQLALRGI